MSVARMALANRFGLPSLLSTLLIQLQQQIFGALLSPTSSLLI